VEISFLMAEIFGMVRLFITWVSHILVLVYQLLEIRNQNKHYKDETRSSMTTKNPWNYADHARDFFSSEDPLHC